MKVSYKNLIRAYRGKHDGLVYYYHPGLQRHLAREYVAPRSSESNRRIAAVARNLRALDISAGYRGDLRLYLRLLDSHADTEGTFRGNYWMLFTRLMWNLADCYCLDLETVTREDLAGLPCATVKDAVEAGLLAQVPGCELLVRPMFEG